MTTASDSRPSADPASSPDASSNNENLQAANAALQRQLQQYRRSEKILLRQTAALSKTTNMLVERDRLLHAFQEIGKAILAPLELDQILDTLAQQIVRAGIFRSIMIALVDEKAHTIEVARNFVCQVVDGRAVPNTPVEATDFHLGLSYDLDEDNITAEVARTGHMQVIVDWDDRFDSRIDNETLRRGQVSYFVPVLHGDRVLAVLATGSELHEKETMLHRLEIMRPLLDQMAIALEHAHLYAATRQQTEQLVRLERMRAVGEMAVGISHNLNNLLAGIMVPAQLLEEASSDPQIRQDSSEIIAAATRAADLVQRLNRAVQTQEGEDLAPIDLNLALQETLAQIQRRWQDPSLQCSLQLHPVPPIGALGPELQTILANLLENARDAMPEGGTITLTTLPHDKGAELKISDTGNGMDDFVRQRVFEPFFTTKNDVGPGLGLSMVYNIVTCWGGSIDIESTSAAGTTFSAIFPKWHASQEERDNPTHDANTSGHLLLVEADPKTRSSLSQTLSSLHQVDSFSTGKPALQALLGKSYDVLIANLDNGDIPGDLLVRQARRHDPSLAAVLIDNWSNLDGTSPSHANYDFRLDKPLPEPHKILQVIGRALALHRHRAR